MAQLLVLGAFLAAGATALPALAQRAAADQASPSFPGGRYFVIGCGFSHSNNDDPIAFPGKPGASHNHTYIGNRTVDAATTPASLLGGESSCGDVGDASAYWVPTLFAGRRALMPLAGTGYYVRRTSGPVQAFPPGLKMIVGNANATRPQPLTVVGWGCGGFSAVPRSASVPSCPPNRFLHLRATFPNCWNGRDVDSPDHKRHLAYSSGGRCPRSHPVALPSLVLVFLYPSTELGRPIQASGRYGTHADFVNGWDQETLERLVAALN
ncbi:MAG: DUF1996 domain-containing protein [Gaiellaceae bacterium]